MRAIGYSTLSLPFSSIPFPSLSNMEYITCKRSFHCRIHAQRFQYFVLEVLTHYSGLSRVHYKSIFHYDSFKKKHEFANLDTKK